MNGRGNHVDGGLKNADNNNTVDFLGRVTGRWNVFSL